MGFPATTFEEAVDLTIVSANQQHQIINGSATEQVQVEDGTYIPTVRKALVDNLYFKSPINWSTGTNETVFNQLRSFSDPVSGQISWWYAPNATNSNPILMPTNPTDSPNWVIYGLTNNSLYQVQKRLAAEAGFNLVGTFFLGCTLSNATEVILDEFSGKYYSWSGVFPKVVTAGSTPTPLGSGGWIDRSDVILRGEMAEEGSSVIIAGKTAGDIVLEQAFSGTDLLGAFFRQTNSALYLYGSRDGLTFSAVSPDPVYSLSGRALRDPSVIKYGDAWWCIYSNVPSDADFNTTYFGIAKSYNLVDWQHAFDVNTGVPNTWAPDWFVDDDGSVYAVIALNFNTHLIPLNLDAGTSGTPVSIGIPGSSIDGVIQKDAGIYYLFIKNEATKFIERYTATVVTGPYTKTGSGDWAGWGADVEGPCVIKQADGTWRIYFDGYLVGKYYTSTSNSLSSNSWSTKAEMPQSGEIRHGSVYPLINQSERLDSLYAVSQGSSASTAATEVVFGMPAQGQAVTSKAEAVRNSCWMHFRTDMDVAVFQSRGIAASGLYGIDFVDRKSLGYASVEVVTAGVSFPCAKFWGPSKNYRVEFPYGIVTDAWQTSVTYLNGWQSNNDVPFKYKKDPLGRVTFTGIVNSGTATSVTTMFTIPTGYRPPSVVVVPVVSNDISVGTVGITPAGEVIILSGTNVKLDLSSVSYYVD